MSLPVPGWYADPWQPGRLRFWDGRQWTPHTAPMPGAPQPPQLPQPGAGSPWSALDRRVAAMRAESAQPWGAGPVLVPIAAFLAVVFFGALVAGLWQPEGSARYGYGIALTVAGYAVIAVALWRAGRPIAARHGGWGAAFGWARPTGRDLLAVGPWFVANMLARIVAAGIVIGAVPAWQHAQASNVDVSGRPDGLIAAATVVFAVVAPPIEELMFRGLILRTFMRRIGFWPAAIASSVLFGLFHTYQLGTLAGVVLLGVSTAVFGFGQCLLVRRHVRLGAAVGVHALSNLVAVLLALFVVT